MGVTERVGEMQTENKRGGFDCLPTVIFSSYTGWLKSYCSDYLCTWILDCSELFSFGLKGKSGRYSTNSEETWRH